MSAATEDGVSSQGERQSSCSTALLYWTFPACVWRWHAPWKVTARVKDHFMTLPLAWALSCRHFRCVSVYTNSGWCRHLKLLPVAILNFIIHRSQYQSFKLNDWYLYNYARDMCGIRIFISASMVLLVKAGMFTTNAHIFSVMLITIITVWSSL